VSVPPIDASLIYVAVERPVYEERDPRSPMSAVHLVRLLDLFDGAGVTVWLDGGWGVDALLGEQTREHDDVDLVVSIGEVPALFAALEREGYAVAKGELPTCVVLLDDKGRQVDVHPVAFDEQGGGVYAMEEGGTWTYPAEGFEGRGSVLSHEARCLTPEVQVLCHAGYELDENDLADLAALRDRFGVRVPERGT
jgi:lincosamide nucleotidyltransferase A/C/D/E